MITLADGFSTSIGRKVGSTIIFESSHHSMDHSERQSLVVPATATVHCIGVEGERWIETTYEVRLMGRTVATIIQGEEIGNSCNYGTRITVHELPAGCSFVEVDEREAAW